jgi:DNA polymerase IV
MDIHPSVPRFVYRIGTPRRDRRTPVGPATGAKMERLGIRTGKDLRERPLAFLQEHFGKAAAHFHAVARGEDHRPVRPDRPRKSAGSETTYPRDLGDPREVEAGIEALADEVWRWCEKAGAFGRTVTVKVRYADFRTLTRSRTRSEPFASRSMLVGAAVELVRGVFPLEKRVRLLGVAVSGFGAGEREDDPQIAFDFGQSRSGRGP